MSVIRDEIRAILREELAALLSERPGALPESIRIETSDDLNAFARRLVKRMSSRDFADKVKGGEIRFVLDRTAPAPPSSTGTDAKPGTAMLDKKLITEADLAGIGPGTLRVPQQARVTPLAKDRARRRGIRIKRVDA
ncbi:MAG: hypothetical protein OXF07_11010 [Rhodobacter sp.]|nr:hypothetical protein [Rhodobacter sp.]MCY4169904.1 hypothetical protein [Rhodobacter sp.]MCY4242935.1 hypothetical protein [Rhodobacter sp.]